MSNPDSEPQTPADAEREGSPIAKLAQLIGQAARFNGDLYGLGNGERAALARLDPDGELRPHQIAALARALHSCRSGTRTLATRHLAPLGLDRPRHGAGRTRQRATRAINSARPVYRSRG